MVTARVLLDDQCGLDVKSRLPKMKGVDSKRATLEDMVKFMLDPSVNLPPFYAVDLSRWPPVTACLWTPCLVVISAKHIFWSHCMQIRSNNTEMGLLCLRKDLINNPQSDLLRDIQR